jgi:hypothetical protein
MANGDSPLPGQQRLPGEPTPLEKAQKLAEDATNKVVQQGQGFYYRDTPGEYVGSGLTPSQKVVLSDEQFEYEIQRILGDETLRRDLAIDLYRDRSITNASSINTDSGVASGLLNSVAKYKASSDSGNISYLDWLANRAAVGREAPDLEGSGGRGAGGYSGPVTTNTISALSKRDVEVTLNDFATEMLGRNLTDQELKKYSKKFQKQDLQAQVNVRTPNGQSQLTSVTKEKPTRETMAMDIIRGNEDYATNTINTDVMDIMAQRLGL